MKITKEVLYEALMNVCRDLVDEVKEDDHNDNCKKCPISIHDCPTDDEVTCSMRISQNYLRLADIRVDKRKEILK